jgi:hypothetical protein
MREVCRDKNTVPRSSVQLSTTVCMQRKGYDTCCARNGTTRNTTAVVIVPCHSMDSGARLRYVQCTVLPTYTAHRTSHELRTSAAICEKEYAAIRSQVKLPDQEAWSELVMRKCRSAATVYRALPC